MNTFQLKDAKTVPDVIHEYSRDLKFGHVPIVIDNGSYQCRVGWSNQEKPKLIFKNLIAKTRRERGKKESGGELQVGNEIVNIEAVRFQLKMQFDRNIVTHMEAQEQLLDYAFYHLGIDTDGKVDHPILMTEPFLNLNYCRQMMSELLFECYNIPALNYSVDSLLSYNTYSGLPDGLIVSFGYHTTHIIPVLKGRCDPWRSRRINLGGFHIINYLHRLLQLKYPSHFNAITISRAEELIHDHTFIALNYDEELKKWSEAIHYDENVHVVQLPYSVPVVTNPLSVEQQKEKKKELARRLIEINARKREEKLAEEEEMLQNLLSTRELYEEGHMKEFSKALHNLELTSIVQLHKQIAIVETRIEKIKQKIIAANTAAENADEPKPKPVNQILGPRDREDFDAWLADIKQQRQQLLSKRMARRQRKRDLAQRRTAAAQERMRLISQLARKDKKDDNFGSRDEDWDVYKAINKDAGSSDSEEENERLNELEEVLKHHDPAFVSGNNDESMEPGESHQLHVGIERMRAPEVLFQPALVGNVEAGLAETIEFVLKRFTPEEQNDLVSNIFLTGGCASFPGLPERLERELMEIRPYKSSFKVSRVPDSVLAAWKGGRKVASSPEFKDTCFTKADYEEKGGEYFKEHVTSNFYFPSPQPTAQYIAKQPLQLTIKSRLINDFINNIWKRYRSDLGEAISKFLRKAEFKKEYLLVMGARGDNLVVEARKNRLEDYKSQSVICDQETRRLQLLLDQKRRREKSFNDLRNVDLFSDWNVEDNLQEEQDRGEPMDCTTIKPKKPRLKDMFMLSEWMAALPEDFEAKWMFVLCPVGKRCLVHCSKGLTSVYGKRGQRLARFQSALPNGSQKDFTGTRYSNAEVTILDCIWNSQNKSYFILDLLSWKGQFCMETEMSFRVFWIKSKLEEMPELSERSEFNSYPFIPLKYYPCDIFTLSEHISQHPYFPSDDPKIDGILFYHSEAHYTPGSTPLVLWLKPFMLPEVLGIEVPDAYEQMKPSLYVNKEVYVMEYEKRKKKKRHKKSGGNFQADEVPEEITVEVVMAEEL